MITGFRRVWACEVHDSLACSSAANLTSTPIHSSTNCTVLQGPVSSEANTSKLLDLSISQPSEQHVAHVTAIHVTKRQIFLQVLVIDCQHPSHQDFEVKFWQETLDHVYRNGNGNGPTSSVPPRSQSFKARVTAPSETTALLKPGAVYRV